MGGREDHSHSSPSLSNSGMKKLPVSRKGRRKGVHGERKRERISKCTKGQKHIPKITSFPKPHHSFFDSTILYCKQQKLYIVEAVGMR